MRIQAYLSKSDRSVAKNLSDLSVSELNESLQRKEKKRSVKSGALPTSVRFFLGEYIRQEILDFAAMCAASCEGVSISLLAR